MKKTWAIFDNSIYIYNYTIQLYLYIYVQDRTRITDSANASGADVFLTFALAGGLSTRLPARLSTSGTEQGMALGKPRIFDGFCRYRTP
jgi:hypothetical protein